MQFLMGSFVFSSMVPLLRGDIEEEKVGGSPNGPLRPRIAKQRDRKVFPLPRRVLDEDFQVQMPDYAVGSPLNILSKSINLRYPPIYAYLKPFASSGVSHAGEFDDVRHEFVHGRRPVGHRLVRTGSDSHILFQKNHPLE